MSEVVLFEDKNKDSCPVCYVGKLKKFLERKNMPVHQHVLYKEYNSAKNVARTDIILGICDHCGFIFNREFDLTKVEFGDLYDSNQDFSDMYMSYIHFEIDQLITKYDLNDKNIVEVGCGQGTFLKKLVCETGARGYGFDPSYIGEENSLNHRVTIYKKFYDMSCTDIKADMIICRHVLEHVPDPLEFLRTIKQAAEISGDPIIFFEIHNVAWTLRNNKIYNFFSEYCNYFCPESMKKIFEIAGYHVLDVTEQFNGQYLWLTAKVAKTDKKIAKEIEDENQIAIYELANRYLIDEKLKFEKWNQRIIELSKNGKTAVWGAGAKGITFVNLFDPSKKYIDFIIDINTRKQGCYAAGTGHLIIDCSKIIEEGIKNIIVLNPNYLEEIKALIDGFPVKINLIDEV